MVTGLGHLAVTVKDMQKSLEFYTNVLGFKRVFEIDEPETGAPWIIYLHVAGHQFVELFYDGLTDNPWNDKLRGFNHICLEVDDIQAAAKRIEDAGWPLDIAPNQGCDHNWQCWITDPDGIRIELMQLDEKSPHMQAIRDSK